jgi:hypothetical protein
MVKVFEKTFGMFHSSTHLKRTQFNMADDEHGVGG